MKRLCYRVAKSYTGQEFPTYVSDGALTSVLKGLRNSFAELSFYLKTTQHYLKKVK